MKSVYHHIAFVMKSTYFCDLFLSENKHQNHDNNYCDRKPNPDACRKDITYCLAGT